MKAQTSSSQTLTLAREVVCHEKVSRTQWVRECRTIFELRLVELDGGLVGLAITYRGRRLYIPPVVSDDAVPLPQKYARYFDPELFPELRFVPYGHLPA